MIWLKYEKIWGIMNKEFIFHMMYLSTNRTDNNKRI